MIKLQTIIGSLRDRKSTGVCPATLRRHDGCISMVTTDMPVGHLLEIRGTCQN